MTENLTLRQMSAKFGKMALADKFILRSVGKHVKNVCKSYIGVKQSEWSPLKASTEKRKASLGAPLNSPLSRSGDSEKDIHYKTAATYKYVDIYSNSEGLLATEFGTPTQEPRQIFGLAVKKEQANIEKITGAFMMAALSGRTSDFPALIAGDEDVKLDFMYYVRVVGALARRI